VLGDVARRVEFDSIAAILIHTKAAGQFLPGGSGGILRCLDSDFQEIRSRVTLIPVIDVREGTLVGRSRDDRGRLKPGAAFGVVVPSGNRDFDLLARAVLAVLFGFAHRGLR
jgi:hypothetical protein